MKLYTAARALRPGAPARDDSLTDVSGHGGTSVATTNSDSHGAVICTPGLHDSGAQPNHQRTFSVHIDFTTSSCRILHACADFACVTVSLFEYSYS
jgi:hypothetical protein